MDFGAIPLWTLENPWAIHGDRLSSMGSDPRPWGLTPLQETVDPKCRSWILVFSRKERKDRKAYRDGGLLLDFQAHPLF